MDRGEGLMGKDERVLLAQFFLSSPRCDARTKRNKGKPCRQPAMKNGRCRLHGGLSTGAKTIEGKRKSAMANYKHGHYTQTAMLERKKMRMMMQWRNDLAGI